MLRRWLVIPLGRKILQSELFQCVLNTEGIYNTALGAQAQRKNTTADNNTGLGAATLFSNTTGSNNTASGVKALNVNSTGSNNTAGSGINLRCKEALRNTTGI